MPPLRVRVYDIPIKNAFALPGGHIVITRGLLREATDPEEVAGLLAHEVGHVARHHPEAQMIRIAGAGADQRGHGNSGEKQRQFTRGTCRHSKIQQRRGARGRCLCGSNAQCGAHRSDGAETFL